jgi:Ribosomal protein L7Ae/L30e/S12e/Gadd45 family
MLIALTVFFLQAMFETYHKDTGTIFQALDKRQALLCILSENCDEPMYKKLVTALCMEHGIPLIKVNQRELLIIDSVASELCRGQEYRTVLVDPNANKIQVR